MSEIFNWLLTPISGASNHYVEVWVSWHARLMVFAWAILLPLGVMVARYFKVTSKQNWPTVKDNKFWWHVHRIFQYSGVTLMIIAAVLAVINSKGVGDIALWHARIGWIVVSIGILQIVAGIFRGTKGGPTGESMKGDHYDMTPRRVVFEWTHKLGGYVAILLACIAIILGLYAADAPRWMWIVIFIWWILLIGSATYLQHQGRCIDTYQAIWGPDTSTQASMRKPIGLGITRYTETEWIRRNKNCR
jgi:Eukaryotic cytochrome b561